MEMDMSLYLGAFLDEVDEQLQILEEEVLHLEQDSANKETIEKIFRAAHTLKGSSAAMGMNTLKELTHKVENVFDDIRNDELQVNTEIINLIFESIDMIKLFQEGIVNGTVDAIDVSLLIEKLESCKSSTTKETVNHSATSISTTKEQESDEILFPEVVFDEYQKEMVEKTFDLGMNVIAVYVSLNTKALLKSVRAFLIHNNLKEIGEIFATYPNTDILEDEDCFNGNAVFVLATQSKNNEVLTMINKKILHRFLFSRK